MSDKNIRIRVSALIIENDKVLCVKHRKNENEYYLLPGGGLDFGENINDALKREMKEELNADIDPKELLFISESISPDGNRHIISVVVECLLTNKKLSLGVDERVCGFDFLSMDELAETTFYPDFKQTIIEYIKTGRIKNKLMNIDWIN